MKKIITAALLAALAVPSLSACKLDTNAGGNGATVSNTAAATPEFTAPDLAAGKATKVRSKPKYTVAQQNAIESAQSYLEMSPFSRAGLIEQLSSKAGDGFDRADAVFAVNHIKVNWYKEAVESAKSYLEMTSFSRAGLIEQLSSPAGDQYTLAQARYAVKHVGL